jgi:hypothetical protein
MAHSKELSIQDWLNEVKSTASSATAGPIGACLVPNPQTGQNDCVRTDSDTCQRIGGTFMGGPCGPIKKIPKESE